MSDLLRSGDITGEILMESNERLPLPRGPLGTLARLGESEHPPWPVFWTRHDQARLLGTSALLVDQQNRACAEAMFLGTQDGDPGYYALSLSTPVFLRGNWTSLLSRWSLHPNYYHWMLDCLPRLAILNRLPPDTRVLVPPALRAYQSDTLRWLGLDGRIQSATEAHLCPEHFFFSAPASISGWARPSAVEFLRREFLPRADTSYPVAERVYVRRRAPTRCLLNESQVEAFLEHRGWRVVDPELLKLSEQIRLFSHARVLCGAHGAGLTNLLWCRPGCVAIELCADNYLNGCYESIASCLGIEHRFLVHDADGASRFHVDLKRLERILPD